ncbi:Protein farnesyltransferase/geranylgeranyltransferase type-1 subunit alpha [Hypsizygus marmoreus]|uniref:Protein farnesyltransferase/geranylgeranyltransferase type-1 subunit alpha n=1 Tax=Hypsizygus marmoreus TaxID=39966 RepID=A0A369K567_HYPMA|nr:Protein farnesyltransferase/geranylgeranyltransferase type-1 subunit alpha [Hypsizygus marmoreus]
MPTLTSSSTSSLGDVLGLYSQRQEWSDVTPLPQYEEANPAAPIFYSEEYKDATDYFRGIVRTGEKSQRVLELTETIIRLNPAHYSAWQYRYETLLAINAPLDVELKLMDELAVSFLKTYQVWHHRRLLLTITRNPAPELAFIAASLKVDAKNYHTWSYRQWLLAFFNDDDLWAGELDFVDAMLAQDVRNNSAWHHRFFVVFQSGLREGETDRGRVIRRELTYVKQNISLVASNPSAWNYLRGILDANHLPYTRVEEFVKPYAASTQDTSTTDLVDLENPPPPRGAELPCAPAIEFLADIFEKEGGKDGVRKASELWRSLADEYDKIRKKYWEYRIREALQTVQE